MFCNNNKQMFISLRKGVFNSQKVQKKFPHILTHSPNINRWGGSPGLVVMGGDSRSKGRGFESRRRILDGHDIFSHLIVVKLVLFD